MKKLILSTSDFPSHLDDQARFKLWRENYCDWVGASDLAPISGDPFAAQWEFTNIASLTLARFSGTAHHIARTSQQVAASPHGIHCLSFNLTPQVMSFSQRQKDHVITGDRVLFSSGTEAFRSDGVSSWLGIGIPAPMLNELVPNADSMAASQLDGSSPAMRHLRRYLGFLYETGLEDDPALIDLVETTLCDLVALGLGAAGDAATMASGRGLRAARLAEILQEIAKRFADPAFSVQHVAAKTGLSPNYIQKLLHDTPATFTERVVELRLQAARDMLANRQYDGRKVSDIAFACGFNDVSYFNRCFRRRFGCSPTQYRGADEA